MSVYREVQFDFVRKSSASGKRLVADQGVEKVLLDINMMLKLILAGFKAKVHLNRKTHR